MPDVVFTPANGRVTRIIDPYRDNVTPAMLTIPGLDYESFQLVINSIDLQTNPKFQVTETLGDAVFLVAFGESVGPAVITGLIFESTCDSIQADPANVSKKGINKFMSWWESINVASSNPDLLPQDKIIQITLGGGDSEHAIRAFIGQLKIAAKSTEDQIWSFSMQLLHIPKRKINPELINLETTTPITVNTPQNTLVNTPEAVVARVYSPPEAFNSRILTDGSFDSVIRLPDNLLAPGIDATPLPNPLR